MTVYNFDELTEEEIIDLLYDELEPDGDIDKVRACIEAGANVNKEMPILVAITSNRLDMVKLLVESGVSVNKINSDNQTALFHAKFLDRKDIIEYLEPITSVEIREITEQMMKINQPKSKKSKKKQ
jgi:ankyrin repeat protein